MDRGPAARALSPRLPGGEGFGSVGGGAALGQGELVSFRLVNERERALRNHDEVPDNRRARRRYPDDEAGADRKRRNGLAAALV
ncbi:MAG: hypothetical protein NZ518_01810 [Dehalococcoidia bacterium]|nr:hypothetical protein [Dehalococcoidia bacterium]